jgi:ubiquinone/menaquinone biosynthesis C-methylase UbiE/uncharacterized protein YbaR (Trm112 family)
MKFSIVKDLICINHSSKQHNLKLDQFLSDGDDCREGFLACEECGIQFPIINGVPIIVRNFDSYIQERTRILGDWILKTSTSQMRNFLREKVKTVDPKLTINNKYEFSSQYYNSYLWTHYDYRDNDRFLSMFKYRIRPDEIYSKVIQGLEVNVTGKSLDLGCALGASSLNLAKKVAFSYGVDLSYSFITEARRRAAGTSNIEYLVCDIADLPFKSLSFDVVMALNILDRTDFDKAFLSLDRCIISGGELVITDPFDSSNDSKTLNSINLRLFLEKKGYQIRKKTQRESYIPWIVRINERAYLFYFADYIYAVKLSSH